MVLSPLSDSLVVGIVHDVTDKRRVETTLEYHTRHDAQTKLANGLLMTERLRESLDRVRRHGGAVGCISFDLDDFKQLNDHLGRETGDTVLNLLARRIERLLRGGDTLARLAGDEFAIICNDVESLHDVRAIAERVCRSFDDPITIGKGSIRCSAGFGAVISTDPDDTPERIMRDADTAMRAAKRFGRGYLRTYDEDLCAQVAERLAMEAALRDALARDEFRVYYQPVVGFEPTEVIGFEALVRWEHPERGLLAPGAFLPVAEETGLIVPIGTWVLEEACRQAARWARESTYDPPLTVSVNLSARQLAAPDIVPAVGRALAAADLDPEQLVLEVNARVLTDERGPVRGVLYELASLGVRLSVDDFGAGKSSLRYLKTLPVHALKIDRALIDGLGSDRDDAAVVAAIVALGHALGLTVTAAGIETPRQLSEVRSLGCDVGQGFYFARPQPGEIVRALVHRRFRWREHDPAA